ncbi:hypothetical protein V2W45_1252885 [Cenococcum geophilum]
MAAFPEGQRYYPCKTQRGLTPTFATPPDQPSGDPKHPSIVLGLRDLIPRWTASTSNPTKLLYFVVRDGFASDADHKYTATSFQQAADEWNVIGFGLNISAATDKTKANFLVKYYKAKKGDDDEDVLASAFFPNKVEDVLVYDKTLVEPDWRKVLKNTFLHEIGHIIGLRHEFALDLKADGQPRESTPAVRFGSQNEHSVMSYDDVNYIQESDKKDVKDFYKLQNKSLINGVPLTDYAPKPLGN